MFVTKLIKNRKTREAVEDKIEVIFAAIVITGFVVSKLQKHSEPIHFKNESNSGILNIIDDFGDASYDITVHQENS